MKRKSFTLFVVIFLLLPFGAMQAQSYVTLKGKVITPDGLPLPSATVQLQSQNISLQTDINGEFEMRVSPTGSYSFLISEVGYKTQQINYPAGTESFLITLQPYDRVLTAVEVFGHTTRQPDKLDAITAMPLKANEQIQSVSSISNRLIRMQDNQDISDALRNVTGVILFSNFGGIGNSYTIRGIRGINTLLNGIQLNNDTRGHGIMPDMETIDNIQVLKGSYSISQGLSNSLGSVGGVVNAVTKTPNFVNTGSVGIRYGSWDNIRGVYDIEHLLNDHFSIRVNGAAQAGNGYRAETRNNRFVINPSFKWKIDERTSLTGEYHYQYDSRTPDRGTINLAADSVNGLWNIPNKKFLGFSSDHNMTYSNFWGLRFVRSLTDKLDFKINYYGSTYNQDFNSAVAALDSAHFKSAGERNVRYRYMNRVTENDKSTVINIALAGHDLYTFSIRHTFQAGFDFRKNKWFSQAFNSAPIDTINVYENYSNTLSNQNLKYTENTGRYYNRDYSTYGLYGQDMITFNKYLRALIGARYSHTQSLDNKTNTYSDGHGVDPIVGLMVSPFENISLFGSYTTVSDISTAEYLDENSKKLGNMITRQYELGVKSGYFHNRLRFNFTYFIMNNDDYAYQVTNTATGHVYYNQSGSLKRNGMETELVGHVLSNLEVLLGYTYLNAKYEGVKSYVDGSQPMGTARNLANGWVNYIFNKGALEGLSLGLGAYYVGARPVDDFSKSTRASITTGGGEIQKITAGVRPFSLEAYTTINAQISYTKANYTVRAVLNNISNSKGYTAYYPQAFLTPTDPRNFGLSLYYTF